MKSNPFLRRSDPFTPQIFAIALIMLTAFLSVLSAVLTVRKSPNTTPLEKHVYKHNTTAKPAARQLREIHLAWISLKAEFHCPVSCELTAHERKYWRHLSVICKAKNISLVLHKKYIFFEVVSLISDLDKFLEFLMSLRKYSFKISV